MSDDYCELCDLPLSTCVHGLPPEPVAAPPKPKPKPAPKPRATRTTAKPEVPVRRAPRKWSPPEVFRPHIVTALEEAGGALAQDEVFAAMEPRLADVLLEGDHQRTPEGELRWQYAARRARQAMLTEGVMTKGQPGIWQLAD